MNLSNKTVVVTGAAGGLGKALVRQLIRIENASVIAVDLNLDELKKLEIEMNDVNSAFIKIFCADLTKDNDIQKLFCSIVDVYSIDGIINNAGITHFGLTDNRHMQIYEKIISVNYLATVKFSLLFLEHFKRTNGGFIYNITSLTGLVPVAYQNVYSSTKHAIQSFTYGLKEENKNKVIFIGMFAPGGIDTPMFDSSGLATHFKGKKAGIKSPENVAVKVLASLKKQKLFSASGLFDWICIYSIKIFPGSLSRKVLGNVYSPRTK